VAAESLCSWNRDQAIDCLVEHLTDPAQMNKTHSEYGDVQNLFQQMLSIPFHARIVQLSKIL
jgi:hypothetical protein